MIQAPGNLIISKGRICMKDGTSSKEYLAKWQEDRTFPKPDGTEVCVLSRKGLQYLYDEIAHHRSLTLVA